MSLVLLVFISAHIGKKHLEINNNTCFEIEKLLRLSVSDYCVEEMVVEIKYSPINSRRYISGTYYRLHPKYPNGKFIRIRVNQRNKYPIEISFKTSEYYQKKNRKGEIITYQKMKKIKFHKPEDLITGIFLHEFSHYLDHIENRNGNFKQTKADKFAVTCLENLGIII